VQQEAMAAAAAAAAQQLRMRIGSERSAQ